MIHDVLITYAINVSAIVAFYIFPTYCLMRIAEKTATPRKWFAWIPILNLYLSCKIARKPGWWTILLLVPFLNLVIGFLVYSDISLRLGKPFWIGILMAIPFSSPIGWGYLAFTGTKPI